MVVVRILAVVMFARQSLLANLFRRAPRGAAAGLDRAEHERLEGRAVHDALLVQPVGYN